MKASHVMQRRFEESGGGMLTLEQKDKRLANKTRRRIFTGADEDTALLAASLGELGWTSEAIMHATGYTIGQVQTRLKFAGVHRASWSKGRGGERVHNKTFRNGESAAAQMVARAFVPKLQSSIESVVQSKLENEQRHRFSGEGINGTHHKNGKRRA